MSLELAQIRRRVQTRLADVKRAAAARRDRADAAGRAYGTFLSAVAIPTFSAVAQSLSAEGYPFTVTTPGRAVRMTSDRSRLTYVEIGLDTSGPEPQIIAEVGWERGSRVFTDERPVAEGTPVDAITDEHVLARLLELLPELVER
ncbi:MAG TPA: hypothetical protein PLN93_13260 [Vicinamibacterales bacterium]|nr:hypothetical protein [Vicinamibacterales bacterium]HOG28098.1 hypothetical protein [Vicinamibacterales bacterium]HOQ59523.1 hypothetical protein [Vicinamibacterales bacterium]HPK72902.1 hypothetical protein [Vicinamibacterales bacterium]HPW19300.1 hypothetical protein [Vicinamibacterales bacterium]